MKVLTLGVIGLMTLLISSGFIVANRWYQEKVSMTPLTEESQNNSINTSITSWPTTMQSEALLVSAASTEDVSGLKKQIAEMSKQIAMLNAAQKQQPDSLSDVAQKSKSLSSNDFAEESGEVMEARQLKQSSYLQQVLESQEVDQEWASESMNQVQLDMQNQELSNFEMVDMSCGSTLCRVELKIDDNIPIEESVQRLSVHRSWDGATSFSVDSHGNMKLFFARSGYNLPDYDEIY